MGAQRRDAGIGTSDLRPRSASWISLWQIWWRRMVGPAPPPFTLGRRRCTLCGASAGIDRPQSGQTGVSAGRGHAGPAAARAYISMVIGSSR